ncbi:putative signal peptide protein [Puccinia sorghi]|uniref:Putative signal peptide protein n=1 Tax=Puccinia sorghi TaxID=27349 RepID=A0A0L6VF64_9BASI|nr:putative signal peptide protein [Puccinia sorghi]
MPGPQLLINFCHHLWLIDYLLVDFLEIFVQD